jgi:hypothetical protein
MVPVSPTSVGDPTTRTLRASLSREHVLASMRALSKAGKLPGYSEANAQPTGPTREVFRVACFATPFDRELLATVVSESDTHTELAFRPRLLLKVPLIMLVVCILSVWPGVWLTDSMIRTYFPSYDWNTNLWYIPLTVISVVWYGISAWRKANAEAKASAAEAMQTIADALPAAQGGRTGDDQRSPNA